MFSWVPLLQCYWAPLDTDNEIYIRTRDITRPQTTWWRIPKPDIYDMHTNTPICPSTSGWYSTGIRNIANAINSKRMYDSRKKFKLNLGLGDCHVWYKALGLLAGCLLISHTVFIVCRSFINFITLEKCPRWLKRTRVPYNGLCEYFMVFNYYNIYAHPHCEDTSAVYNM